MIPRGVLTDLRAEKQLVSLLSSPLDKYDPLKFIALKHVAPILSILRPFRQREIARNLANAVMKANQGSETLEQTQILLDFLKPLLGTTVEDLDLEDEEEIEDASLVARVVHVIRSSNKNQMLDMLNYTLDRVLISGEKRSEIVVPVLCFQALNQARIIAASGSETEKLSKWYQLAFNGAVALSDLSEKSASLALQLLLTAALSASQDACDPEMAYECMEQAFLLFEESIADNLDQIQNLHSIIATLHKCLIFDKEERDILVHKSTAYCSKLMRKSDQCAAVLACAFLYWQESPTNSDHKNKLLESGEQTKAESSLESDNQVLPENLEDNSAKNLKDNTAETKPFHIVRDPDGVLSCLKRALRIANASQKHVKSAIVRSRRSEKPSTPGWLFVDIANAYLDWFVKGLPGIDAQAVQNALDLASNELGGEYCLEDKELLRFWENTKHRVLNNSNQEQNGISDIFKELAI